MCSFLLCSSLSLSLLLPHWPWHKSVWQWEQRSMLRGCAISGALHGCSVMAFFNGKTKLSTSCPSSSLRASEWTTCCPQAVPIRPSGCLPTPTAPNCLLVCVLTALFSHVFSLKLFYATNMGIAMLLWSSNCAHLFAGS